MSREGGQDGIGCRSLRHHPGVQRRRTIAMPNTSCGQTMADLEICVDDDPPTIPEILARYAGRDRRIHLRTDKTEQPRPGTWDSMGRRYLIGFGGQRRLHRCRLRKLGSAAETGAEVAKGSLRGLIPVRPLFDGRTGKPERKDPPTRPTSTATHVRPLPVRLSPEARHPLSEEMLSKIVLRHQGRPAPAGSPCRRCPLPVLRPGSATRTAPNRVRLRRRFRARTGFLTC